jgi:hypothetical protein
VKIKINFIEDKRKFQSPKLQGSVVEPILLLCIDGSSFYEIASSLAESLLISSNMIKRYLFYLINYDLVSYNGQKRVFTIEIGGFKILSIIDNEKQREKTRIEDIVITIE